MSEEVLARGAELLAVCKELFATQSEGGYVWSFGEQRKLDAY